MLFHAQCPTFITAFSFFKIYAILAPWRFRMTLQQTLTIPKTTTHLSVDLSEPIPAGTATFWLEWAATPITDSAHEDCAKNIRELRQLCKGSSVTVDSFLEKRHRESDREDAKFRRLFHLEGE
jgi:hypothetical protein